MRQAPVSERTASLWRHPDFLRLWIGQAVSFLGSEVSGLAIPLTAVLALGVSAWEMGLLAAAGSVPALLVGLVVGPSSTGCAAARRWQE